MRTLPETSWSSTDGSYQSPSERSATAATKYSPGGRFKIEKRPVPSGRTPTARRELKNHDRRSMLKATTKPLDVILDSGSRTVPAISEARGDRVTTRSWIDARTSRGPSSRSRPSTTADFNHHPAIGVRGPCVNGPYVR